MGALLQISDHASGKSYLLAYDGNGNIAPLSNATTGALAAVYEYTPFGKSIRTEVLDSALTDQPFRFSTKWTDDESGLVYYDRRYYDPRNGRFVDRDPIVERGGINLFAYVRNNPTNRSDYLGMWDERRGPAPSMADFNADQIEDGDYDREMESWMGCNQNTSDEISDGFDDYVNPDNPGGPA